MAEITQLKTDGPRATRRTSCRTTSTPFSSMRVRDHLQHQQRLSHRHGHRRSDGGKGGAAGWRRRRAEGEAPAEPPGAGGTGACRSAAQEPTGSAQDQRCQRTTPAGRHGNYGTPRAAPRTTRRLHQTGGQAAHRRAEGGVPLRHHSLRHVPVVARHEPRRLQGHLSRRQQRASISTTPSATSRHGGNTTQATTPDGLTMTSRFLFNIQTLVLRAHGREPRSLEELDRRLRQLAARLHRHPVRDRGGGHRARAQQHAGA